jgi:transcriptional regulator with XRE-family HTH domain|tara:strand:+ start:13450 stop:13626 length:177 start_codon:yes stop_codon:yes gene_type:complete
MPETEWIRRALHDRRPSIVAEATGLHVNTIIAIKNNTGRNPRVRTLDRLAAYLEGDGE